ncbi:hypothetical protein [Clavibacter zhangzhiyongii]|uniref:hypothetical protein n=1 Tax=Clavibacter zhangzhiyongii TaxID=2768071 RepID=UPI0039E1AFB1
MPSFYKDRRAASLYLASVLGTKEFPFPKDVDIVARWINIATSSNPSAVVLDFFGGTGTTAESVMRLNAADGGRRQSIVVTNNELSRKTADALSRQQILPGHPDWEAEGIFEKITKPRITTIVTGERTDGSIFSEGHDENVAFFQLTYEDENLVALGKKFDAISSLLWLRAGGRGEVVQRDEAAGWALPGSAIYGVLFDVAKSREFADAVEAREAELTQLYIVADSESAFQAAVAYLPAEHRLKTARLYSDYLHSFEINGRN